MMKQKAKFKETEIGKIPEDWSFEELEKHAKIVMGQSPESKHYNMSGDGTVFLQGVRTFSSLHPNYDTWTTKVTKLAKKDSVLLSVRAPVGEVNLADRDVCIGRGLMSIDGQNNKFIFYLFRGFKGYVINKETGTVYGSVTRGDITKLKFPFPELEEQSAITKILSGLDAKIELNQKMNKTLEAIGQAIFKRWFVDFEFPDKNGKPYKSSGGEMVDSELGLIPGGWKVGRLGDYSDIKNGFAFKGKDFQDKGIPVIKIKNVKAGKILLNDLSYVSQEIYNKSQRHVINFGDLLITMSGNRIDGSPGTWVGKVAVFPWEGKYLLNQRVSRIDIKNEAHNLKYYISILLSGEDFQHYFINHSTSSGGQANISPELVGKIELVIPEDGVLRNHNQIMDRIFSKISSNEIENNNLSSIRDSLLPRLMSGKIRVRVT